METKRPDIWPFRMNHTQNLKSDLSNGQPHHCIIYGQNIISLFVTEPYWKKKQPAIIWLYSIMDSASLILYVIRICIIRMLYVVFLYRYHHPQSWYGQIHNNIFLLQEQWIYVAAFCDKQLGFAFAKQPFNSDIIQIFSTWTLSEPHTDC